RAEKGAALFLSLSHFSPSGITPLANWFDRHGRCFVGKGVQNNQCEWVSDQDAARQQGVWDEAVSDEHGGGGGGPGRGERGPGLRRPPRRLRRAWLRRPRLQQALLPDGRQAFRVRLVLPGGRAQALEREGLEQQVQLQLLLGPVPGDLLLLRPR